MLEMDETSQAYEGELNETRNSLDILDALIDSSSLPHSNSDIKFQPQDFSENALSSTQEANLNFPEQSAKKRSVEQLYEQPDQRINPPYTGIFSNNGNGYFGYFNNNSTNNPKNSRHLQNSSKNNQQLTGIHQKHPFTLSIPSNPNTAKFSDLYPTNQPVQWQTAVEQHNSWNGPVVQYDDIDIDQLEKLLNGDRLSESESETDLSTSSSTSSYNNALVPDDLRTPFTTRRGKIPRLLKHDLRRFYPSMFINVLNAQDETLLSQYFERFYVPQTNLKLLHDLADVWTANNKPTAQGGVVCGRSSVVDYFQVLFRNYPDLIFTLSDVDITRNNFNHKCTLKLRMKIQWTQMVPTVVPMDDEGEEAMSNQEKNAAENSSISQVNHAMDVDEEPAIRVLNTKEEDKEQKMDLKVAKKMEADTDTTGDEEEDEAHKDLGKTFKSFPSQDSIGSATCEMPIIMQIQQDKILQDNNNQSTLYEERAATNIEENDKAQTEDIEDIRTEKPRKTRILWEKIAFEVHADVPFILDEDWYITQIDSATLSRTLDKVQAKATTNKQQQDQQDK